MTVNISKPAVNLREELADLRNQGTYQEQQFYFDSLVTNGTFDTDTDWTKNGNWSIAGGVAVCGSGTTNAQGLVQSGVFASGKVYQYSVTVSGVTGGEYLRFKMGETGDTFIAASSGTYTGVLANRTLTSIDIRPNTTTTTSNITVDNISVYESDGTDVVYRIPKGWKPKDVFEDGLLQREGAAHDYEVVYDGFDYYVKPAVAPGASTQTCVIGVRT